MRAHPLDHPLTPTGTISSASGSRRPVRKPDRESMRDVPAGIRSGGGGHTPPPACRTYRMNGSAPSNGRRRRQDHDPTIWLRTSQKGAIGAGIADTQEKPSTAVLPFAERRSAPGLFYGRRRGGDHRRPLAPALAVRDRRQNALRFRSIYL